jgi:hypothetical protein
MVLLGIAFEVKARERPGSREKSEGGKSVLTKTTGKWEGGKIEPTGCAWRFHDSRELGWRWRSPEVRPIREVSSN